MIATFNDKRTAAIFAGELPKGVAEALAMRARRVLRQLDAAKTLDDVRVPPSNRLHKLKGDRKGQWSLSVNDQYRIAFRWKNGDAHDVEFTDYH